MQHWKSAFLTIVAGQTVSLIGSAAVQFSMIWWLSTKTNSPLMLALAGLAAFVPQLILGPFAGVWIDRMKRKRVVIAADLFMGTVAALFSLCFLFTSPPAWSVCLVLGIRAVGTVFHTPAMQALVPRLVPREELVRASSQLKENDQVALQFHEGRAEATITQILQDEGEAPIGGDR